MTDERSDEAFRRPGDLVTSNNMAGIKGGKWNISVNDLFYL